MHKFLNTNLTAALREVRDTIHEGHATSEYSSLSDATKLALKEGHSDLKQFMTRLGKRLEIETCGLRLSMGMYQSSNRAFPHLWGAYIPNEVKRSSHLTPQLFIFVNESGVRWGMGPSDAARGDDAFISVFERFYIEKRSAVAQLLKEGFSGTVKGQNKGIKSLDEIISSRSFTIAKSDAIEDMQSRVAEIEGAIFQDLSKLKPLYLELVDACRSTNLLATVDDGDDEKATTAEPLQDLPSWYVQWRNFWTSPEEAAQVPAYLQKEFGATWKSIKQQWEIGRRESLLALMAAADSKDPGKERVHELVMGGLRRTNVTGGWRTSVVENYSKIAKALVQFIKANPKGCSKDSFDVLLKDLHPLTGETLPMALASRWLCDLEPRFYLPISKKFTVLSLRSAGRILKNRLEEDLDDDDYGAICREAIRLAGFFPEGSKTEPLYLFDFFLYWVQKHAGSGSSKDAAITDAPAPIQIEVPVQKAVTLEELCERTGKSREFFETIKRRLLDKGQVVFSGPPGTGKSLIADLFSSWFRNGGGQKVQVQFHPSYAYEDFIEGFRPSGSQAGFRLVDGVFKSFCATAASRPDEKFVFVIDELNRGHLPQIFGELLYLLEYRGKTVTLPYSKDEFAIPINLAIVATMNTADRSIALVDFALRRRFEFFEFNPDTKSLENFLNQSNCQVSISVVLAIFTQLNAFVESRMGKQYCIGHSFFMKPNLTEETLRDIWAFSVVPLLDEYFFDDRNAIQELDLQKMMVTATSLNKVA